MANYYISSVASAGSDSNDGIAAPVRTVRRLRDVTAETLTAGDVVSISGTHRGQFNLGDYGQGTIAAPMTVTGHDDGVINPAIPLNPKNNIADFHCAAGYSLDTSGWSDVTGGAALSVEGTGATIDNTGNPQGVGAASFDGAGALSTTSFTNPTAFTVCFWVKFDDLTGTQSVISQWSETGGQRSWYIYKSGSTNRLRFRYSVDGTTNAEKEFGRAYVNGEWAFVAVVIRPNTFDAFEFPLADLQSGGNVSPNRTMTGLINPGAPKFALGCHFTGAGALVNPMSGSLDGVTYHDEALDDWEIEDIALRWIDGLSNPWVNQGGGIWTLKTLNTPFGAGSAPRSLSRLFADDVDVNHDGQEADAISVDSANEYFLDPDGTLTYYPSNNNPNSQEIELTTYRRRGAVFFARSLGGASYNYIALKSITVKRSVGTNINMSGSTGFTATFNSAESVITLQSNYAGMAISGAVNDATVTYSVGDGNDHAMLYINVDATGVPDRATVTNNIASNNRRQGMAIEEGHDHIMSGNLIYGTRYDGVFSRGIQLGGAESECFVDSNTFYDNQGPEARTADGDIAFLSTPAGGSYTIRNNLFIGKTPYMFNANIAAVLDLQDNIYGFESGAVNRFSTTDYTVNDVAAWEAASGEVNATFTSQKLVVNSGSDFLLAKNSPAIQNGGSSSVSFDILRNPYDNPPSQGAYEYIAGGQTMAEFGTKLQDTGVGAYTWSMSSPTVRSSDTVLANEGAGGPEGLVTFFETTEEITLNTVYMHGYVNAGGPHTFDVWVVECEDQGGATEWYPNGTANAAALTTKRQLTFTSTGNPGETQSAVVNEVIPAGKKLLLVAQPVAAQTGGFNIANLNPNLSNTGQSRSVTDAGTSTSWLNGSRAIAMWAEYTTITPSGDPRWTDYDSAVEGEDDVLWKHDLESAITLANSLWGTIIPAGADLVNIDNHHSAQGFKPALADPDPNKEPRDQLPGTEAYYRLQAFDAVAGALLDTNGGQISFTTDWDLFNDPAQQQDFDTVGSTPTTYGTGWDAYLSGDVGSEVYTIASTVSIGGGGLFWGPGKKEDGQIQCRLSNSSETNWQADELEGERTMGSSNNVYAKTISDLGNGNNTGEVRVQLGFTPTGQPNEYEWIFAVDGRELQRTIGDAVGAIPSAMMSNWAIGNRNNTANTSPPYPIRDFLIVARPPADVDIPPALEYFGGDGDSLSFMVAGTGGRYNTVNNGSDQNQVHVFLHGLAQQGFGTRNTLGLGVGGDSMAQMLARINVTLAEDFTSMVVQIGTNDLGAPPINETQFEADVKDYIEQMFFGAAKDTRTSMLLMMWNMPPPRFAAVSDQDVADAWDYVYAFYETLPGWWDATYPAEAGRLVKGADLSAVLSHQDMDPADKWTYDGQHATAYTEQLVGQQLLAVGLEALNPTPVGELPLPLEDFIGTHSVTAPTRNAMLRAGSTRARGMFNNLAQYGDTTTDQPLDLDEMLQSYTLADLDDVMQCFAHGGKDARNVLTTMVLGYNPADPNNGVVNG